MKSKQGKQMKKGMYEGEREMGESKSTKTGLKSASKTDSILRI